MLLDPLDVRTRAFPVAVASLLDFNRWHVVSAGWRLQSVTADFVILYCHRPTGVAEEGVTAILQQP